MKNSFKPYVLSAVASVVLLGLSSSSLQAACTSAGGVVTCTDSSYTDIDYRNTGTTTLILNNPSMVVSTNGVSVGDGTSNYNDVTLQANQFNTITSTVDHAVEVLTQGNGTINLTGGSIFSTQSNSQGVFLYMIGTPSAGKGTGVVTLNNIDILLHR